MGIEENVREVEEPIAEVLPPQDMLASFQGINIAGGHLSSENLDNLLISRN